MGKNQTTKRGHYKSRIFEEGRIYITRHELARYACVNRKVIERDMERKGTVLKKTSSDPGRDNYSRTNPMQITTGSAFEYLHERIKGLITGKRSRSRATYHEEDATNQLRGRAVVEYLIDQEGLRPSHLSNQPGIVGVFHKQRVWLGVYSENHSEIAAEYWFPKLVFDMLAHHHQFPDHQLVLALPDKRQAFSGMILSLVPLRRVVKFRIFWVGERGRVHPEKV